MIAFAVTLIDRLADALAIASIVLWAMLNLRTGPKTTGPWSPFEGDFDSDEWSVDSRIAAVRKAPKGCLKASFLPSNSYAPRKKLRSRQSDFRLDLWGRSDCFSAFRPRECSLAADMLNDRHTNQNREIEGDCLQVCSTAGGKSQSGTEKVNSHFGSWRAVTICIDSLFVI
jgi:hypothetical protein